LFKHQDILVLKNAQFSETLILSES